MFEGERTEFARLVRAYSAELFRFAYWLSRDRFVAEDLVQETFARAWSARKSLREERAAKRWLYTILHNEHARLFVRKRLDMVEGQDLDALEDQRLAGGFDEIAMREALHELASGYREPLLLQVLGGFNCEEIAQLLNLTPGAVMTRLSRARLTLRRGALAATDRRNVKP
jgi:RNA polymerase sigma-70 factor (ECF subfamily)